MASEIFCSYRFLTDYWQADSSRCQKERKNLWGKSLNTEHFIHYFDFLCALGKELHDSISAEEPLGPAPEPLNSLSVELEASGLEPISETSEELSPHPASLSQHLQGLGRGGVWSF